MKTQKAGPAPVGALERIPVQVFSSPYEGSVFAAAQVADLIRKNQGNGKKTVLGLATGSTPKAFYEELVRLHREEGLSFKNVITFNLDEYYPMNKDAGQSYHSYMRDHLFDHIDIDPANTHIPDGACPAEEIGMQVAEYDRKTEQAGGIDLQILGIGNNGHIGFNEPGSGIDSPTRLVQLADATRIANAHEFADLSEVPHQAVTMGIRTILKAKRILLLAWGAGKAEAVQKAVVGKMTEDLPASLLQRHDHCVFLVDQAAASNFQSRPHY
ncbi:MAG: glucosamine-6-phosphate deaminase [Chitinophagaceae bacterium]